MDPRDAATGTGVRLLFVGAKVATVVLVFVTTLVVMLAVGALKGEGGVALDASLTPPYTVGLGDDRSMTVGAPGRVTERRNFDIGAEGLYIGEAPTVQVRVNVSGEDTDTRTVGVAVVAALLGLAWIGLMNLRGIVQSARLGDPFDQHNVRRFRWLAGAVLAAKVILEVGERVLDRTLDIDVPVDVTLPAPGWLPVLGAVLGLLALSEVFRTGSGLQLLEHETV